MNCHPIDVEVSSHQRSSPRFSRNLCRKFARLFPEFGMTDHERRIFLVPDVSSEEEGDVLGEEQPPRRPRIDMRRELDEAYEEVRGFPEFGEV